MRRPAKAQEAPGATQGAKVERRAVPAPPRSNPAITTAAGGLVVRFKDGREEALEPARAVRLILAGVAEPGAWGVEDVKAWDAAMSKRLARQVEVLSRDGLLVNTAPAPLPRPRFWWRW